jgi:hypothetical protein
VRLPGSGYVLGVCENNEKVCGNKIFLNNNIYILFISPKEPFVGTTLLVIEDFKELVSHMKKSYF